MKIFCAISRSYTCISIYQYNLTVSKLYLFEKKLLLTARAKLNYHFFSCQQEFFPHAAHRLTLVLFLQSVLVVAIVRTFLIFKNTIESSLLSQETLLAGLRSLLQFPGGASKII